jgi:hypothetical protein
MDISPNQIAVARDCAADRTIQGSHLVRHLKRQESELAQKEFDPITMRVGVNEHNNEFGSADGAIIR